VPRESEHAGFDGREPHLGCARSEVSQGQNAKWLTLAPMFPAVLKADAKPSLLRVYEFAA
jgi:hypothetical protein